VLVPETLVLLQQAVEDVYVDPAIIDYAVRLTAATRDPAAAGLDDLARYVSFGASPRAPINLVLAARALAYVRGRDYVLPDDVSELALDVLRHRLVLTYEALTDELTADDVLRPILAAVPVPDAELPVG
jgi:MoxR-like ATPase